MKSNQCTGCGRILQDGEHCYGPKEYEGQKGPNWILCIKCARNSNYTLIDADSEKKNLK